MNSDEKKSKFSLIDILLLFGIILVSAMIYTDKSTIGKRNNPTYAKEKACYANMRMILGAVEIYNSENEKTITDLSDSDATSEEGVLVKGNYLKSAISRPTEQCHYSGNNLTTGGQIVCREHGTAEGPDDN